MSTIQRNVQDRWFRRVQGALNHDFCPWANKWVYWLKSPLWCMVLACGAAVLCGLLLNHYMFLVAGALTLVIGSGVVYPWISLRGVRCDVRFRKLRIREGETVEVLLHVSNRCPWPVCGISLSRGFVAQNSREPAVALTKVGAWSTYNFVWNFHPSTRGVYPSQQPEIETSFPFGLFRAAKPVLCHSQLIVWPQTVALNVLPESSDSRFSDQQFTDRKSGEFGDLLGTRQFREGDSLRRVHWAQTARHGNLIVCERQSSNLTHIDVSVDLRAEHHSQAEHCEESIDAVIRIAASICESMHRQHASIECRLGSAVYHCGSNAGELQRLLDAFAAVPRLGTDGDQERIRRLQVRAPSDALKVFVTTDLGGARAAAKTNCTGLARYVVVKTAQSDKSRCSFVSRSHDDRHADSSRDRKPWLVVEPSASLAQELPKLWRKACHAQLR